MNSLVDLTGYPVVFFSCVPSSWYSARQLQSLNPQAAFSRAGYPLAPLFPVILLLLFSDLPARHEPSSSYSTSSPSSDSSFSSFIASCSDVLLLSLLGRTSEQSRSKKPDGISIESSFERRPASAIKVEKAERRRETMNFYLFVSLGSTSFHFINTLTIYSRSCGFLELCMALYHACNSDRVKPRNLWNCRNVREGLTSCPIVLKLLGLLNNHRSFNWSRNF